MALFHVEQGRGSRHAVPKDAGRGSKRGARRKSGMARIGLRPWESTGVTPRDEDPLFHVKRRGRRSLGEVSRGAMGARAPGRVACTACGAGKARSSVGLLPSRAPLAPPSGRGIALRLRRPKAIRSIRLRGDGEGAGVSPPRGEGVAGWDALVPAGPTRAEPRIATGARGVRGRRCSRSNEVLAAGPPTRRLRRQEGRGTSAPGAKPLLRAETGSWRSVARVARLEPLGARRRWRPEGPGLWPRLATRVEWPGRRKERTKLAGGRTKRTVG